MIRSKLTLIATASVSGRSANGARAQDQQLTLCWAAWDPANALAELSKDFTAESGIQMKFEFVPWTNFADRFLNELNSGGKLCDLMIGDSQWLGAGAEYGHYVKLNDFFAKEGISMDDFLPATVYNYSTWPKGEPRILGAAGDGRRARLDLPQGLVRAAGDPGGVQGRIRPRPRRAQDWDELMDIAKFFQGRDIDGKTVYGAAIYTERGSEGITMGVTSALYSWGFQYQDPTSPTTWRASSIRRTLSPRLEFYKDLFKCCTPPGHTDAYMTTNLDAYKSGQVAMQMNWFAFMPGIAKDADVGGDKSGFFVNPPEKIAASTLGGQGISVVSYSDKQDQALEYIKWFAQPEVQKKWWSFGGYSCHKAVLEDPGFASTAPFAADFLTAMSGVKDFWQEPTYAELLQAMQKRVHDYVVADQGTAQEALDKLIEDWTVVFEDDGKL